MIDFKTSYKDLCSEIEILELRVDDLKNEKEMLYKNMHKNKPLPLNAIDYTQEKVQGGIMPLPLDRIVQRLGKIETTLEELRQMLESKLIVKRRIEEKLNDFEGLEYRVAYLRDIKCLSLPEIADELGYSYDWIKKISSRTRHLKATDYSKRKR